MEPDNQAPAASDRFLQTAVWLVVLGLLLVLIFLIVGFQSWSVGLGLFLGTPLLVLGMLLYVVSVIRDLQRHNVLGSGGKKAEPQ